MVKVYKYGELLKSFPTMLEAVRYVQELGLKNFKIKKEENDV